MSTDALKAVATNQATPQQARSPYEALKHKLEISKSEFLPLFGGSQQNVDRFVRVVLNAVIDNPDLLDADRGTLISACMKAASDGLMPDSREAVLNIYNTKVKRGGREEWIKAVEYLPMVGGMVKSLYDNPEVLMVDAAAVYENDKFTYRRGDDPKLEHEPTMGDDPGALKCAYIVVTMKSGEKKREVMPTRDIEKARHAGKNPDGANSPWVKWYDQMAIKSVIHRASKQLPRSNKFDQVAAHDNEALGFAATPQSVAEIVARPPAPAIEHQPAMTVDVTPQKADPENVPAANSEDQPAASNQEAKPEAPATEPEAAQKTASSLADYIALIADAPTKEEMQEAADAAGALPLDMRQQKELTAAIKAATKRIDEAK